MTLKAALRTLAAVIAGMAVAVVLIIAVEVFSAIVHPLPQPPAGSKTLVSIPEHVKRYPHWILAVVVVLWGATAAAATGVASRVGNRFAGTLVALLLAWALIFNLTMLPYVAWFKVVMLSVFPVACLLGIVYGKRVLASIGRA